MVGSLNRISSSASAGRLFRQGGPEEIIREDVLIETYETGFKVREMDGKRIATFY